MPRILSAELKITSPTTLDKVIELPITNPILDQVATDAFIAEAVKNSDGSYSKTEAFEGELPYLLPVIKIRETMKLAGEITLTLSAEEA
jgi:hypothetical protein